MNKHVKYAVWTWVMGYVAFGLYFAHNGTYLVTANGQEATAPFWSKFVLGFLLLPSIGCLGLLLLLPFIFLFVSLAVKEKKQEEQERKDE